MIMMMVMIMKEEKKIISNTSLCIHRRVRIKKIDANLSKIKSEFVRILSNFPFKFAFLLFLIF